MGSWLRDLITAGITSIMGAFLGVIVYKRKKQIDDDDMVKTHEIRIVALEMGMAELLEISKENQKDNVNRTRPILIRQMKDNINAGFRTFTDIEIIEPLYAFYHKNKGNHAVDAYYDVWKHLPTVNDSIIEKDAPVI